MNIKRTVVVGVFDDATHARDAVAELRRAGFEEPHIGVVTRDENTKAQVVGSKNAASHATTGAAAGLATGAGIGALWAVGLAAGLALPVIGPVLVGGGLLASILATAGVGAALAGLVGAPVGLGIPEHEARAYEEHVKAGRTLVTVRAEHRYDEAHAILRRFGGYDAASAHQAGVSTVGARV